MRPIEPNHPIFESITELEAERDRYCEALDTRTWTKEMQDAWHQAIPDVQAAFDAIRKIAER